MGREGWLFLYCTVTVISSSFFQVSSHQVKCCRGSLGVSIHIYACLYHAVRKESYQSFINTSLYIYIYIYWSLYRIQNTLTLYLYCQSFVCWGCSKAIMYGTLYCRDNEINVGFVDYLKGPIMSQMISSSHLFTKPMLSLLLKLIIRFLSREA